MEHSLPGYPFRRSPQGRAKQFPEPRLVVPGRRRFFQTKAHQARDRNKYRIRAQTPVQSLPTASRPGNADTSTRTCLRLHAGPRPLHNAGNACCQRTLPRSTQDRKSSPKVIRNTGTVARPWKSLRHTLDSSMFLLSFSKHSNIWLDYRDVLVRSFPANEQVTNNVRPAPFFTGGERTPKSGSDDEQHARGSCRGSRAITKRGFSNGRSEAGYFTQPRCRHIGCARGFI